MRKIFSGVNCPTGVAREVLPEDAFAMGRLMAAQRAIWVKFGGTRVGGWLAVHVFSRVDRALFRWTGGRFGLAPLGIAPWLLLTTRGRKSGREHTVPLIYVRDGDRFVVAASAGGQPGHPAWWFNVNDDPRISVQVGRTVRSCIARTARGVERDRLWAILVATYPGFHAYQARLSREIPVVVLGPEDPRSGLHS